MFFGLFVVGGVYILVFCDIVVMVEGNVFMYLGLLRMVEMVIGEKVFFEEMGGVCMYCLIFGCGDIFVEIEEEVICLVWVYLLYFLVNY